MIVRKVGEGKNPSTPDVSYTEYKEMEMCCYSTQNKKLEDVTLCVLFPQITHAVTCLEMLSMCVRIGRI